MKPAPRTRVVVLLVLLTLLAAACAGSDDGDRGDSASTDDGIDAGGADTGGADAVEDATDDEDAMADDSGGDDSEAADEGDAGLDRDPQTTSQAQGAAGEPDLSAIVTAISAGVGGLDAAQEQAIQGVADGQAACDHVAGERARPASSQIEVEIVTVVDGCLHFTYDVANFRSLIEDLNELREGRSVVAVSPMLLDYRLNQTGLNQIGLNQIESPWTVEAIAVSDLLARTDGPTGQGAIIAVIDSGIDLDDPALAEATVLRAPNTGQGDYTETGHGTVAASIIVAPILGASRGIAPAATLLDVPADLCDRDSCGCDPCAEMTAAEAIRWSTDNGATIISMSFGYRPAAKPAWWQLLVAADQVASTTATIDVALAYAEAKQVAMAAAAGNCAEDDGVRCENEDQFEIPAGHESVIGVGALDQDDEGFITRAWYSTRQSYVEIAAPGSVVVTNPDGELIDKVGTSFATPFVSAALAVLLGSDGPLAGRLDAPAIARQMLIDTAVDLAPDGRDSASGHGQLQLGAALDAAAQFVVNNPETPVPDED